MKNNLNTANLLSGGRILLSLGLLFCPARSGAFYTLYIAAGLSDMLDGAAARRSKTASAFGARLDSFADLVFLAVCLLKLLPVLPLPRWSYWWIAAIAAVKALNLACAWRRHIKTAALHTAANKLSGLLLFLLPLSLPLVDLRYSAALVCAAASFAAVQEGHCIRTGRTHG